MQVIAEQGNRVYLLLVGEDMARVLDLDQGKLFPAYNVHSILARGYWEKTSIPLSGITSLLNSVDILDDYPPHSDTMRVTMFDIESFNRLATIESRNDRVRTWENADPKSKPTGTSGVPTDFFDNIDNWTQLVLQYRQEVSTPDNGDEFLFALVDQQPSSIVGFTACAHTWKIEQHKAWRERHRERWER